MFDEPSFLAMIIVGLTLGGLCFAKALARWQTGLSLTVLILFFGGIVGINLGSGAYPIAFRDVFIVLPLYLGLLSAKAGRDALSRIPPGIFFGLTLTTLLVMVGVLNSYDEPFLQIAIGLKVWLYYVPFLVVGMAVAADGAALLRFLRLVLFSGLAVCVIGLTQAFLVRVIGFHAAIALFFGTHAYDVTQGFAHFSEGGGIYRIPGTFSFAGQYSLFVFTYMTFCAVESRFDPDPSIRKIATIAIFVAATAGIFSGARAAFLIVPMLLVAYMAAGVFNVRSLLIAPVGIAIAAAAVAFSDVDLVQYFLYGRQVAEYNERYFIFDQIAAAANFGFFGDGIGSSTGAARYAIGGNAVNAGIGAFESYYAKIAAELGLLGLLCFCLLFLAISVYVVSAFLVHRRRSTNAVVAPIAIFIAMTLGYSLKGYLLDTDPTNIFFWLCLGILVGVNRKAAVPQKHADSFAPATRRHVPI